MYNIKVENDLNITHQDDDSPIGKFVRGSIRRKSHLPLPSPLKSEHYWSSNEFQLNTSHLYNKLEEEVRHNILRQCNLSLLNDFYFLEKSGLAYCAKMLLLGETTQIRQLYGLIAADEATHLEWFTPYIQPQFRTQPQGKLLHVLAKIVENCDANTMYYLVQTIIEGWGFITYKTLADSCECQILKGILHNVLRDEAVHHKAGEALFDSTKLSIKDKALIKDRLKAYMEVLRVGPHAVVQSMEQELGELSVSELESTFSDLKTELISGIKLRFLKKLMLQPGMETIVNELYESNYAKPYTPSECAKIFQSTRGTYQYVT